MYSATLYFFRPVIAIILSSHQRNEPVVQEGDMVCTDQSGRWAAAG